MPKLDLSVIPVRSGSDYPSPFAKRIAGRSRQALGDAGGLTDFGVNLTKLPPGAWSSHRHWHSEQEEFVYVLSGELTLITDDGENCCRRATAQHFRKIRPMATIWSTTAAIWRSVST